MRNEPEKLIPPHGGDRNLKSFQVAQLIYDVTVRFSGRYVDWKSRTRDQMVQAARSGVQNVAEGSEASATSKKTELKLTNVARASLEELRLDCEDFLRQRGLAVWPPGHPALVRFKGLRCATLEEFRAWVKRERQAPPRTIPPKSALAKKAGPSVPSSVKVRASPCPSVPPSSEFVANAALSLLNLCSYLLKRQLESQAAAFEKEGGFTERLYRVRSANRNSRPSSRSK